MTPERYHEFFVAAAGVAGALVGLLFVAVSVTMERMAEQGETQVHRVRASAALTSFSNALVVSLFALVPGVNLGYAAFSVGVLGLLFVVGALLSMLRLGLRRPGELRGALFLVGLIVVLVLQLRSGIKLLRHYHDHGAYETISILVICCFMIGIARSWELIGGPSIRFAHELFAFGRSQADGGASAGGGAGAVDRAAGGGRDRASGAGESRDGSGSGVGLEAEAGMGESPDGEGGSAEGS